jgi:hypothetical protein
MICVSNCTLFKTLSRRNSICTRSKLFLFSRPDFHDNKVIIMATVNDLQFVAAISGSRKFYLYGRSGMEGASRWSIDRGAFYESQIINNAVRPRKFDCGTNPNWFIVILGRTLVKDPKIKSNPKLGTRPDLDSFAFASQIAGDR